MPDMKSERNILIENEESLAKAKQAYVRCWADIEARLPEDFNPHYKGFAKTYFRFQLRLARGQRIKAGRIFSGLMGRKGYQKFEEENKPLLAAIDIAVKGRTNWQDDLKRPIKPLFRLNGS